jgi:hypothetical protein
VAGLPYTNPQFEEDLARLRRDHEAEMDGLRRQQRSELRREQDVIRALEDRRRQKESELASLDAATLRLKSSQQGELERLKREHESVLQGVRREQDGELAQLRAEHAQQIKKVKVQADAEIREHALRVQHAKKDAAKRPLEPLRRVLIINRVASIRPHPSATGTHPKLNLSPYHSVSRRRPELHSEELAMSFTVKRKPDLPPIQETEIPDTESDDWEAEPPPAEETGASASERLLARMDDRVGLPSGDVREMKGFIQTQIEAMHESTLTILASVHRMMAVPVMPPPVVAPPPYAITMGAHDGARSRARAPRKRR